MADKQTTSGIERQDVVDDVVSRGAEESEATTSSATEYREVEDTLAGDEEEILKLPEFRQREDIAMLSAADLKFCNDLAKSILEEGVKASAKLSSNKQMSKREVRAETQEEKKERTRKEVEYFLEKARFLTDTRTHIKLLFITLHKACIPALSLLSTDEAFSALERSGEILYDFIKDAEFNTPPSVDVCEKYLNATALFRKHAAKLESADPVRSAKVAIRFHLCTSAFQNKIQWHQSSQNSVDEAKKLLQRHFKTSYKRMTLYGQACFHLSRFFFTFHLHDSLNASLKQSFDAFFSSSSGRRPSDASIACLYSLPLDVFIHNNRMLTVNFMKHVCSNLMARSRTYLKPSEKILNLASRIWISHLLDNSNTKKFKKDQKSLIHLSLSIPPCCQIKSMTDVLLKLIESNLLPDEIQFKKRLFSFVKDLCLSNRNLGQKYKLLHNLVLAIIRLEDYSKDADFYLDFCKCFIVEMEEEILYKDCGWLHARISSAHLFFCYVLSEAKDYDACVRHAKRAIELIAGYQGEYNLYLEYLRTRAHYICAFSFYNIKDYDQAKTYFNKEIALLEVIQLDYSESLYAAKKHKAFLERRDPTEPVPAGLKKLFMKVPGPSEY